MRKSKSNEKFKIYELGLTLAYFSPLIIITPLSDKVVHFIPNILNLFPWLIIEKHRICIPDPSLILAINSKKIKSYSCFMEIRF